jgi:hypothetical protein
VVRRFQSPKGRGLLAQEGNPNRVSGGIYELQVAREDASGLVRGVDALVVLSRARPGHQNYGELGQDHPGFADDTDTAGRR